MKCLICKQARVQSGSTTVALERKTLILVVKHVPAQVCPNCGEAYVDEAVRSRLIQTAQEMLTAGVQVRIGEYVAVGLEGMDLG